MRTQYLVVIICICVLIAIQSFHFGYAIQKDKIEQQEYIIDSLNTNILIVKAALSGCNEFRNYAFYINKDSIGIDSRGYFYSKYHKTYKYKKE